ncbi:2-C-methyl-D-erythritol 4-phosphate cytidylyltransferase [Corynebacterium sp. HS2168-gen11]|uniref:2-C-methyl-D-erythritol 4-phosphate cytidylyltransferase n=1 Tax=Corynebacterium sp. HS2168-gen11 TaxID=2974027 RepID=UPI00216B0181|nr:2-C-methyl-D-erythritol 4-phosphate cytidylyltransferase [Corynebacterium sp. HS2168-gen11]MCS4536092.1 2-C-methyl-D-erythritol 4-phosphate cytidylyltransferase [Corynebacterium sp. HS2168-gen11]
MAGVPTCSQRPVVALIAAAGTGSRLGAEIPKVYVALRGMTLLERSIRAMLAAEVVDEIIVLISPAMQDLAEKILLASGVYEQAIPIRLVHGGGERADSVWEGLKTITTPDAIVIIHDAARALTPPDMIARVVHAVDSATPAVIPVLEVVDTVKEIADNHVVRTPPRTHLRAVQTPQGFSLAQLRTANEQYFAQVQPDFIATDDASLMEWAGYPVLCVPGDPLALKITTPLDYALAQTLTDPTATPTFEVPDV